MIDYQAPLRDMQFILGELAGLDAVAALPDCEEASSDLVNAILEEAGKFASGVLAPLNRRGDQEGCRLEGERVVLPQGWQAAYDQFREAGWLGLSLPEACGGQGLPKLVSTPVWEMWFSSNMAFTMLPQLNVAQAEALLIAASEAQKATWLEKIVSGEWAATMNLTEPQAGSDLAATRMRAEPDESGNYRLHGQKIYISYGEHELTPNILHLVLARLPDAPEGVKGLSLFLVPKYLLDERGEPGEKNDVRCISIEHKMGIHGSPTCTLSYGDHDGAIGQLIGEPHTGLKTMFIMMNEARFGVGVQGLALGERAYQAALDHARERVQGRNVVSGETGLPILHHPDVKRMLVGMRARLLAMRTFLYTAAGWFDLARHHPDAEVADKHRRHVDLLMPVAKGWCSELGNALCDEAIQVFGGMGFVEETGVAQLFRDARIITIYEGTTGIQANDLLGRKILHDNGATLRELLDDIRTCARSVGEDARLGDLAESLDELVDGLAATTDWLLVQGEEQTAELYGGAVPLLHQLGIVCGGWQLARAAEAAQRRHDAGEGDADHLVGILELARFYMASVAPEADSHARAVRHGGRVLARIPEAGF
ncbi:acyl-CoA dehydrogenase [Halomonas elongata]|uniref:acyl-CoA dehydrogenase n=1 Tax=Halomonas elongata TaxID=2746 RepID=UPI003358ED5F